MDSEASVETTEECRNTVSNLPSVDRTIRARKGTIVFGSAVTTHLRSFLDEIEDNSGWARPRFSLPDPEPSADLRELPQLAPFSPSPDHLSVERVSMQHEPSKTQGGILPSTSLQPLTPLLGFLVSYDHSLSGGEAHVLREGRWIVTSTPAGLPQSSIVIRDESISPMHATLLVSPEAQVKLMDQFSRSGTAIRRAGSQQEERVTESMAILNHGDSVRFGNRTFTVCLVPRSVPGDSAAVGPVSTIALPAQKGRARSRRVKRSANSKGL